MSEALIAQLELTASERPDLVEMFLGLVAESSANSMLGPLVGNLATDREALGRVAVQTARELSVLEGSRERWRDPSSLREGAPNVSALEAFARARAERTQAGRRTRLELIAERLSKALVREQAAEMVYQWTGTKPPKSTPDPDWATKLVQSFLS